jgi:hypothetical protein
MTARARDLTAWFSWGALLMAVAVGPPSSAANTIAVGDMAPDFTLPSTLGRNISLSEFRGKKLVLLEFYGGVEFPV